MPKEEIKEKIDIKQTYGKVCMQNPQEFLKQHNIENIGLSNSQIKQRQEQYGINQVKQAKPKKWYWYLWQSFINPFNLILLGIILVLFYTDVMLQQNSSYANIAVVIALVFISTFLEFFEVYRSNKAAQKLKKLVAVKVTVLREGKEENYHRRYCSFVSWRINTSRLKNNRTKRFICSTV